VVRAGRTYTANPAAAGPPPFKGATISIILTSKSRASISKTVCSYRIVSAMCCVSRCIDFNLGMVLLRTIPTALEIFKNLIILTILHVFIIYVNNF
jgi:hypothetical protein